MSEPFIGEIRMFGGNFAPRGWAFCNGQLLAISTNAALFSILGTTYGGDGRVTFGLPDLRGRVPVNQGQGTGLSNYVLGEMLGGENTVLGIQNLPPHTHVASFTPSGGGAAQVNVTETVATLQVPTGNMLAKSPAGGQGQATIYAPASSPVSGQLGGVSGGGGGGTVTVALTGSGLPVDNRQPLLCVSFIIALVGIFPSRN